jgi:hypothetical protein
MSNAPGPVKNNIPAIEPRPACSAGGLQHGSIPLYGLFGTGGFARPACRFCWKRCASAGDAADVVFVDDTPASERA